MCGIAGIFGGQPNREIVSRMVRAMHHRGPDAQGIYHDPLGGVTMGHTRLSIIDLSSTGHQPMSYGDGRFWIVFNGEVYNYRELKAELEQAGHRFRSTSDTEVVLVSYAEWGTNAIRRFRGMFAFALYDRAPKPGAPSVVLARDRLGIKPLLYAEKNGQFSMASELKALLASGLVARSIDSEALLDFLAVGAVLQPRTILADVKALPPGTWMEIRGAHQRIVHYWDLHETTVGLRQELKNISFEDAADQVRNLLLNAARYNMVSDVPVGAFLSGGIDSTTVVGLMGEASGKQIQTFSVGFEDAQLDIDERQYARISAQHLRTNHHEIVVTAAEAGEMFPNVVEAIDQPSLDGTNTWIVSKLASTSVKVAVSGLGGDELFAGYPHFRLIADAAQACPRGAPVRLAILRRLHALRPNRFTLRPIFRFESPAGRLAMLRRLRSNEALRRDALPLWNGDLAIPLKQHHDRFLLRDADSVQQTSYAELNGYLLSTLIRDGDSMSMAHGLEVRPMLLDHPLVEFVYSLPACVKLCGDVNKALLVRAAEKYLPETLRNRPKMGFEMPFAGWLAGPMRAQVRSLLCGPAAARFFRKSYLSRLQRQLMAGDPPRELWAWAVLLSWCELNRIEWPDGSVP